LTNNMIDPVGNLTCFSSRLARVTDSSSINAVSLFIRTHNETLSTQCRIFGRLRTLIGRPPRDLALPTNLAWLPEKVRLVTYLVSKRSRCRRQRLRYCRKSGVGHVSAPMVFKRRKTGARHLLGHQL